jgi:sirohydrochlorin cobaltochelatase
MMSTSALTPALSPRRGRTLPRFTANYAARLSEVVVELRAAGERCSLSLNPGATGVGQTFLSAGSPDFPVRYLDRATGKSPAPADRNVCPTGAGFSVRAGDKPFMPADFKDATLMIIGHGSTVNGDSGATVLQHASELRRRGLFADVREAFFKIEPRIGPTLAAIRTPRVFVVPFFTAEGYFTHQAIPCELGLPAGAQDAMPCAVRLKNRDVIYCRPVGTHPLMTEIVLNRAAAALGRVGSPLPAAPHQRRAEDCAPYHDVALVIAAHGTELNPDSRKSVERQVELIAARNLFAEVHSAFLEEEPRIADITRFVRAPRIVVVPFFLSDGLHVCEDIPVLLGESEAVVQTRQQAGEWPWHNPTERHGKAIFYTPGVGSEPGIADVILERVRDAASGL